MGNETFYGDGLSGYSQFITTLYISVRLTQCFRNNLKPEENHERSEMYPSRVRSALRPQLKIEISRILNENLLISGPSLNVSYKALKALAPQYISDFLVQYKPPRAFRSSDKKLLQVPH